MPDGELEGSRRIHTDEIRHRIGNNRHLDRMLQRTRIQNQSRAEEQKMLKDMELEDQEEDQEEDQKQQKQRRDENRVADMQASIVDEGIAKMRIPPLPREIEFNAAKEAELEAQRLRQEAAKREMQKNKKNNKSPFVKMKVEETKKKAAKTEVAQMPAENKVEKKECNDLAEICESRESLALYLSDYQKTLSHVL